MCVCYGWIELIYACGCVDAQVGVLVLQIVRMRPSKQACMRLLVQHLASLPFHAHDARTQM